MRSLTLSATRITAHELDHLVRACKITVRDRIRRDALDIILVVLGDVEHIGHGEVIGQLELDLVHNQCCQRSGLDSGLVEEKKAAPKPKMQPRRDAPRRELNLRSAESEVDVRGMSAEEALFEVDNFLSRAIMAGLPAVTVIHGKGTGVLRNAVQQHLRKNKRVKSVRSGGQRS